MDRFNALGRGLQLMLVGSVLLLIDTFLNWQSIDTPIGSFGRSAWHGLGGVLLGLLVIVLLAWLFVRLAAVDIQLPVSASLIAAFLAFLIFIIAAAVCHFMDSNPDRFSARTPKLYTVSEAKPMLHRLETHAAFFS